MFNESMLKETLNLSERADKALTTVGLKSPGLATSKLRTFVAPTLEEIAQDLLNSKEDNPLFDPAIQSKYIALQISVTAPTYLMDLSQQVEDNLARFRQAKNTLIKKIRDNINKAVESYTEASEALDWTEPDMSNMTTITPDTFAHYQQRLLAARTIRENVEAWDALEQITTGSVTNTGLYIDAPFLFFDLTTEQATEAQSNEPGKSFNLFIGLQRGYTYDLATDGAESEARRSEWKAKTKRAAEDARESALFGNRSSMTI